MAFVASAASGDVGNAFSIGPKRVQVMTYSVASGDTTGTITATNLIRIDQVVVTGPCGDFTAAATFSGNVATIAYVNPAATRYGTIICIGV